jgi:hypothetical protein
MEKRRSVTEWLGARAEKQDDGAVHDRASARRQRAAPDAATILGWLGRVLINAVGVVRFWGNSGHRDLTASCPVVSPVSEVEHPILL